MSLSNTKSLLKIGQAAKALGVSIDTLRRWEKAGKIQTIRTPGGTRLYSLATLKKVNPAAVEDFQAKGLTTEELLKRAAEETPSSVIPSVSEGSLDFESLDSSVTSLPQNDNLKQSLVAKFLIGTAVLSATTLIMTAWIAASYLTQPKATQEFFKNNIASGLLSPFHKLAEESVAVISPKKAQELGFIPQYIEPPPLPTTNYQLPTTNVLAVTSTTPFLEVNAPTQINGNLFVRDQINNLYLEGTPSASTITLSSGETTLTVSNNATLDQDLAKIASPTFNTLNLAATKDQLVFQSGGPSGTLTWTPTAARIITLPDAATTLVGKDTTDTLKNKSISGSDNTLTAIPNSALSNNKVTVTAGTNLTGGGDVALGSSVTISLKSSPVVSGVFSLADGTAAAPSLTFTDDADSGLYRIGANKIGLITGGTATSGITIDGSGNVGIGNITPSSTLYVSGNVGIGFTGTSSATPGLGLAVAGNVGIGTTSPAAPLHVWGNGANSAFFLNGNVGIGATSPAYTLDVWGDTRVTGSIIVGSCAGCTGGTTISIADGSAGTPALNFTNDTDTGLWRIGANQIALTTGGGSHSGLSINSSGNVGIGNTSASQIFQVNTGSSSTVITSTGNVGIGTTTTNSNLSVAGNAHIGALYQGIAAPSNGLFVDGNVGIGATTSSNKLDVWGNTRLAGTLTVDQAATFSSTGSFSSTLSLANGTAATPALNFTNSTGSGLWYNNVTNQISLTTAGLPFNGLNINASGNVGIGATNVGGSLVVASGNVGIGTTSPISDLDLGPSTNMRLGNPGGAIFLGNCTSVNTTNCGHIGISNGVGWHITGSVAGDTTIGAKAGSNLVLGTSISGTPILRLVITSSGNVGIGTTVPNATLSIQGNVGIGYTGANQALPPNGLAVSGNVGIGTTSPAANLNVVGTAQFNGNSTFYGNLLAGTDTTYDIGSAAVRFNNLYVYTITATNIAGTVTSGSTSSSDWLINSTNTSDTNNSTLSFKRGSATNAVLQWYGSNNTFDFNSGARLGYNNGSASTIESTTGLVLAGFANDITTGTNEHLALIPNGTGNVGIGTSSPGALLGVLGGVNIGGGTSRFAEKTGPANGLAVEGNVGIGTTTANSNLSVSGNAHIGSLYQGIVAPANGLFVDGNLGIGATTSSNKLDVWGNSRLAGTLTVDSNSTIGGTLGVTGAATFSSTGSFSSTLSLANGTAATPALNFTNSTSTGMYSPSANALALNTNGASTPPLTITSGGNIGIGVTNPIAQLHVPGLSNPTTAGSVSVSSLVLHSVVVQGNVAYVANRDVTTNSFATVDISTPSSPTTLFQSSSLSAYSMKAQGQYIYAVRRNATFYIYSISNPKSVSQISSLSPNGVSIFQTVDVQGRYAYAAGFDTGNNPTVRVIDIADPNNPVQVGSYTYSSGGIGGADPYDIVVQGRYAYLTGYPIANRLIILDVSNPASPSEAFNNTITNVGSIQGIYVQGRYLYAVDNNNKLHVIDVSDPTAPSLSGSTAALTGTVSKVFVQERYAYVSGTTFNVVDVSNPASPSAVGTASVSGFGIFVNGRHAYNGAGGATGTLTILDLGGSYIQQLIAGGIKVGTLAVDSNAQIFNSLDVRGGLQVGNGADIQGPFSVFGGATRSSFVVDRTGNVGIGTTSPGAKLDIAQSEAKTAADYGLYIANTSTSSTASVNKYGAYITSTGTWNGTSANNYGLYVATPTGGTANYAAIFAGGNVGIGATLPNSTLAVQGNVGIGYTGANQVIPSNGLAVSGNVGIGTTTANSNLSVAGNAHIGSLYQGIVAPTNGLFVDGNLGIGATTSSNKLDVWGNSRLAGTLTVDSNSTIGGTLGVTGAATFSSTGSFSSTLSLANGTAATPALNFTNSTGSGLWYNNVTNQISLTTAGLPFNGLNINASGNVGIGITNASSALNVIGNVGIGFTSPTANLHILNTAAQDSFRVDDVANDISPFIIDQTGNVGISNSAPSYALDVVGTIRSTGLRTPYQHTIVVAKSGGDYTTITDALNSITDNSSSNLYLIKVMPGIYAETVELKEYVDIEGSGWNATVIQQTDASIFNSTTANSLPSRISNLTASITAATGNRRGVFNNGNDADSGLLEINNVDIKIVSSSGSVNVGVYNTTSVYTGNTRVENSRITVSGSGTSNYGVFLGWDNITLVNNIITVSGATTSCGLGITSSPSGTINSYNNTYSGSTADICTGTGSSASLTFNSYFDYYDSFNEQGAGFTINKNDYNVNHTQTALTITQAGTGASFRVNDASSDTTPFLIDTSGNVGIGFTSPTATLHVLNTAAQDSFRVDDVANDTSPFIINQDGNLGIGATTSSNKLDVWGNSRLAGTLTVDSNSTIGGTLGVTGAATFSSTGSFSSTLSLANGTAATPALNFTNSTGSGLWYNNVTNQISLTTAGLPFNGLNINASGNVGIGTTNAAREFHVYGTDGDTRIRVTETSAGGIGVLEFYNDAGTMAGGLIQAGSTYSQYGGANSLNLINVQTAPLTLGTSNSVKMTINSAGNVGIGFTSPTANLHILNTAAQDSFRIDDVANDTTPFVIDQAGNVGIGFTSPAYTLDVAGRTAAFNSGQDGSLGAFSTNSNALPEARYAGSSVTVNGYVYVIGGYNASNVAQSTVYYAKINNNGSIGSWSTTTALPATRVNHSSVAANGYVYVIGGTGGTTTVNYAKVNRDGTLGSWSTTTVLPASLFQHTSVTANGYVYAIGGQSGLTSVYYAKLNADGSLGSWTTSTNSLSPVGGRHEFSALVSNGYVYVFGGVNSVGGVIDTVGYAALNTDGSTGVWATTTVLPATRRGTAAGTANGYIYVAGGNPSTTVYYARPASNGTISAWTTNSNSLPAASMDPSYIMANGYFYVLGGIDGTAITGVYYASTARVSLAASLDLLGLSGTGTLTGASSDFSQGSTGGSIYAGNIFSAGNLEVIGNTQFWGGVGFQNSVNIGVGATFPATSPLFSINSGNVTSAANTALVVMGNGNVGIGVTSPIQIFQVNSGSSSTVITSTGNVGIGTTTANSNLSIAGNAHIGSLYQGIVAPTNGLFVDGNLGIGATTSSNKLDVWGNSRLAGTLTVDSNSTIGGTLGVTGVTTLSANNAALSFTGTTPSLTSGSSVFGLFAGGNVGIGTTGNVYGGLTVRGAGTGTNITLQTYGSNLTQGLTALDNGNVGIGTTSPSQILHLKRSSAADTAILFENAGSAATSKGPNSAGTGADDSSTGTLAWSNPENITSSDDTYATTTAATGTTHYLKATNFGFSIPTDATITGIVAEWERHATALSSVRESDCSIVKGGSVTGTNQCSGESYWSQTDAYLSKGSSSNLWGTTWTPSNINASDFGVAVAAIFEGSNATARVDHIRITVYYTSPRWTIGVDDSDSDKFKIANSSALGTADRLTIDSGGNVGIGTTGPLQRFQINDNSGTSPVVITSAGNVGIGASSPDAQLQVQNGATWSRLNAGDSTFTISSSRTFKENFNLVSVNNILDKIVNIPVYTYDYISGPKDRLGLIAEDFYTIFGRGDDKSINYQEVTMATWLGVQALHDQTTYKGESNELLEVGDLVNLSATPSGQLVKTSTVYENKVLGVITNDTTPYSTALSGKATMKVSTENGPIERGDYLTSSSTPGVAMKALRPGQVVGKALEQFTGDSGQGTGDSQDTGNTNTVTCNLQPETCPQGKILAFVNVSFADPGNFLASLSMDDQGNLIIPKIKSASIILDPSVASASAQLTVDNGQLTINEAFNVAEKFATQSAQIANLDLQAATASASIASQSAQLASASAELASIRSRVESLNLTPPDILLASGSATLASLTVSEATVSAMLTAYATQIQDHFKVLGQTTLARTSVVGDLTVDGTLSIENGNSINVISTLYLQNSPLSSSIDIFNGKVIIDASGNITSLGKVIAPEVKTNKLTISNTPIASGSATLAASIGTGTIPANQTTVTILTTDINISSKVFITPTTSTDKVLSVTNIKNGESFDVSILTPALIDINFNWWIVQTE